MSPDEQTLITQLIAQVSELNARDKEREISRATLRRQDDHWRNRTEGKLDKICERVETMDDTIQQLDTIVEKKVKEQLKKHESDDNSRLRRQRTYTIIMFVVAILSVAATLEFIDHEQIAGMVFAATALVTPFLIWILNRA